MKVLTPGHLYELDSMEGTNPQRLQFIQKMPAAEAIELGLDCTIQGNGFVTVQDGTTNEEVLEVLRDRLKVLYEKLPSPETAGAIVSVTHALELLNRRTKIRLEQGVENTPLPHTTPEATGNKFRKKPVVIEAVKYDFETNPNVINELMNLAKDKHPGCHLETSFESKTVKITTLEGVMLAERGDWIIKGVNGELYPCKPDIFEKTYDKV